MEFEDEHDEEQEDEEDEGEEITIPPPPQPPQAPPSYDLAAQATNSAFNRPRVNPERRSAATRYRECLKNHAVNLGRHALDGCGEFMPAGEEGTLDALKCAACNCHRNFHRRETTDAAEHPGGAFYYRTPPPPYLQRPMAALPSTSGGTHSGEIDDSGGGGGGGMMMTRKRFRTKFTQEQKDKMLAFAEKLGWRIQKHDEAAVQQFCAEVQVKRQVFKVWMHNNKNTLGKKP